MGNDADMKASTTDGGRRYSIGELAELTGVSRRTVHFYVQRRIIDPPLGRGRGRHYDTGHVAQILRVRDLQRQGVPLAEMAAGQPLAAQGSDAARAQPPAAASAYDVITLTPVVRIRVEQNVTVEVEHSASPTPELIADLASAVSAIMSKHRGVSETGQAAGGRRPPGATAGPAPDTPPEEEVEES